MGKEINVRFLHVAGGLSFHFRLVAVGALAKCTN